MIVEFTKNVLLADSSGLIAVRPVSASWDQKRCSNFLDIFYVEFMKNFHFACWSKLIAIRIISAF